MAFQTKTPVLEARSTFPANPYLGQKLLQVLAGRNYEFEYNGAGIWVPQSGILSVNPQVFVDPVNGADNQDHGFGPGVNAYRTLQYTWSQIPPVLQGYTPFVYLGPGTYSEDIWFTGKGKPNGVFNYSVIFYGTQNTVVAGGVATGGTIGGAGGAHPSVTGAFAPGANVGNIIEFTSGANNGIKRVIGMTTAGAMWLEGNPLNAAPLNLDTYRIYNWASIIRGISSSNTVTDSCTVLFEDCDIQDAGVGLTVLTVWGGAKVYQSYCKVTHSGQTYGLWIGAQGFIRQRDCFNLQTAGVLGIVETESGGNFEATAIKTMRSGAAGGIGHYAKVGSSQDLYHGCEISGFNYNTMAETHSIIYYDTSICLNYNHGAANVGNQAIAHSEQFVNSQCKYGQNLDGTAHLNAANENAAADGSNVYS